MSNVPHKHQTLEEERGTCIALVVFGIIIDVICLAVLIEGTAPFVILALFLACGVFLIYNGLKEIKEIDIKIQKRDNK